VGVATALGARADLYFFGYGHDYKRALGDYGASPGVSAAAAAMLSEPGRSRYWRTVIRSYADLVSVFIG